MNNLRNKLISLQSELKVPKNRDAVGRYKFRNCEDILTAVKPLLLNYKCVVTLDDNIKQIGDRFYVESVATLRDCESDETISTKAQAREDIEQKGMSVAQLTGSCSSYARKYALNALLSIDDSKDPDVMEQERIEKQTTDKLIASIKTLITKKNTPTNGKLIKAKLEELGISAGKMDTAEVNSLQLLEEFLNSLPLTEKAKV